VDNRFNAHFDHNTQRERDEATLTWQFTIDDTGRTRIGPISLNVLTTNNDLRAIHMAEHLRHIADYIEKANA